MTTDLPAVTRQFGQLAAEDLFSLEEYSRRRGELRPAILAHKSKRRIALGPNVTLYFENRLTMHYQIQEVLRIEKIFEMSEINQELEAYNPLIPDGSNWKATLMIEFTDETERRAALASLIGIEDKVWTGVPDQDRVYAIADEDLDRETSDKTSAVHFLRFELPADMINALRSGATLSMGVEHPNYSHTIESVDRDSRASLNADLD